MHLTTHPFQIKEFVSNRSILIEHLIEFSQFEKDYFVEILAFYSPILFHCFCESLLCFWRNEQSSRIILRMIRPSSSLIFAAIRSCPFRCNISKLFSILSYWDNRVSTTHTTHSISFIFYFLLLFILLS